MGKPELSSFITTLRVAQVANLQIHTLGRPSDLGVGVYTQNISNKVYTVS